MKFEKKAVAYEYLLRLTEDEFDIILALLETEDFSKWDTTTDETVKNMLTEIRRSY